MSMGGGFARCCNEEAGLKRSDRAVVIAVMVPTERVSVLDASNLRVERYGLPMHMAALVILDAGPLLDPSGVLRLAAVRAHIEERTRSVRRMRQVLEFPRRGLQCGSPLRTSTSVTT